MEQMKNDKDKISEIVIRRLTDYLRCLNFIKLSGKVIIKSSEISTECGLKPTIVRKDLSQFGIFGIKGKGYEVEKLISEINEILGINKKKNVVLIGAGNLGTAIIKYDGIKNANFNVIAAFDNNPKKIGKMIDDTKIYDFKKMNEFINKNGVKIVILTVPSSETLNIIDNLDSKHINGLLNFTSVMLPQKKKNMYIHNIDFTKELEVISYCMGKC